MKHILAAVVSVCLIVVARMSLAEGDLNVSRESAVSALMGKELRQIGTAIRSLGLGSNSEPESFCAQWSASPEERRGEIIDTAVDIVLIPLTERHNLAPCVKIDIRSAHRRVDRACQSDSEYAMPTPSDFIALVRLGAMIESSHQLCTFQKELREGTP